MTTIISLSISLLLAYLVYKCFEKYGFAQAYVVTLILDLISAFIKNGFEHFFVILLSTAFISLLSTAVNYWIYQKTNSFISYIIVSILVGIIIVLIPSILIAGLMI